jgi:hypothetical protein
MTRSIRLVVAASSPVLSVDDETKRNVEKHECSLLKVVSDAGSTPAASTISKLLSHTTRQRGAIKIVLPKLALAVFYLALRSSGRSLFAEASNSRASLLASTCSRGDPVGSMAVAACFSLTAIVFFVSGSTFAATN